MYSESNSLILLGIELFSELCNKHESFLWLKNTPFLMIVFRPSDFHFSTFLALNIFMFYFVVDLDCVVVEVSVKAFASFVSIFCTP